MSMSMCLALALAVGGVALTRSAYTFAPVTDRIAGWDVAFVSGISATALGGLGALILAFTA